MGSVRIELLELGALFDRESPYGGPDEGLRFVAFSQVIGEDERDDRVIAERWDLAVALFEGEADLDRIADMRANVTRQEDGRACAGILVWGRANRSERFFDYAVERLGTSARSLQDWSYVDRALAELPQLERTGGRPRELVDSFLVRGPRRLELRRAA